MSVLDDFQKALAARHVDLTVEELLQVFLVRLDENHAANQPLAAVDEEFLLAHGGPSAVAVLSRPASTPGERAARSAQQVADTIASTLTVREAAELTGLDRSTISRRISKGKLWAFDYAGVQRIPRWQFTRDGSTIPGLTEVLAAIPVGYSAAVVAGRVLTPSEELGDASVVDYLTNGGDPTIAASIVSELDAW